MEKLNCVLACVCCVCVCVCRAAYCAFSIPMLLSSIVNGPVSIAIDASLPSLRFYKSGTYADPACKNGPDDLGAAAAAATTTAAAINLEIEVALLTKRNARR